MVLVIIIVIIVVIWVHTSENKRDVADQKKVDQFVNSLNHYKRPGHVGPGGRCLIRPMDECDKFRSSFPMFCEKSDCPHYFLLQTEQLQNAVDELHQLAAFRDMVWICPICGADGNISDTCNKCGKGRMFGIYDAQGVQLMRVLANNSHEAIKPAQKIFGYDAILRVVPYPENKRR